MNVLLGTRKVKCIDVGGDYLVESSVYSSITRLNSMGN